MKLLGACNVIVSLLKLSSSGPMRYSSDPELVLATESANISEDETFSSTPACCGCC